jgi:hypothetical protein
MFCAAPALAQGTVTCESDGGYKFCKVDTFGKATLVTELSSGVCVGGTTWAYDRNGIWVDKGCRATFEVNKAWPGGKPGGTDRPMPRANVAVPPWAVGSFTTHHKDWDTPFTLTIEASGIALLRTSQWSAWGHYDDGLVRVPSPGGMTYQVKQEGADLKVTSLINRDYRVMVLKRVPN